MLDGSCHHFDKCSSSPTGRGYGRYPTEKARPSDVFCFHRSHGDYGYLLKSWRPGQQRLNSESPPDDVTETFDLPSTCFPMVTTSFLLLRMLPRADRPLSSRLRHSPQHGEAAVAPRKKGVRSSPTTGSINAAPQERKRVRSPTGTCVLAADTSIHWVGTAEFLIMAPAGS